MIAWLLYKSNLKKKENIIQLKIGQDQRYLQKLHLKQSNLQSFKSHTSLLLMLLLAKYNQSSKVKVKNSAEEKFSTSSIIT